MNPSTSEKSNIRTKKEDYTIKNKTLMPLIKENLLDTVSVSNFLEPIPTIFFANTKATGNTTDKTDNAESGSLIKPYTTDKSKTELKKDLVNSVGLTGINTKVIGEITDLKEGEHFLTTMEPSAKAFLKIITMYNRGKYSLIPFYQVKRLKSF